MFQQEALYVNSGLAAHTGSGDCLTVTGVRHVSGSEHTLYISGCGAVESLYVTLMVTLDGRLEDSGIGTMSDSQEKAVNVNVILLLFRCAHEAYQMRALHAVLAKESERVASIFFSKVTSTSPAQSSRSNRTFFSSGMPPWLWSWEMSSILRTRRLRRFVSSETICK